MASKETEAATEEFIGQFIRADKTRRRVGDNNRPTCKSQCGTRLTRACKAVHGQTLTDAWERRHGYVNRPLQTA